MTKNQYFMFMLMITTLSSCTWLKGLRNDIEGDPEKKASMFFDFDPNHPFNRQLPPPPATVGDNRLRQIAGTPIDYSGLRAKSGRVTKDDFVVAASKNENSLWSGDGQVNYLFARNKQRFPGDLVTLKIEDALRRDMINEVKKIIPEEYWERELSIPGLTKKLTDKGDKKLAAELGGPGPDALPAAPGPTDKLEVDDNVTAEILERYQNGNLRIRGVKKIPFKSGERLLEVVAIVNSADIDPNDNIGSSKIFEHKLELYR